MELRVFPPVIIHSEKDRQIDELLHSYAEEGKTGAIKLKSPCLTLISKVLGFEYNQLSRAGQICLKGDCKDVFAGNTKSLMAAEYYRGLK